MFDDGK
jgi:hypothetical protein